MACWSLLAALVVNSQRPPSWLGMKFLTRSWFNLDLVWAISLLAVGGFGIWSALNPHVMSTI